MEDKLMREEIKFLLSPGNAHMDLNEAVADFPIAKINTTFPNGTYSPWHLLEHIRRTQHDILDFMINPNYKEMEWPNDYWPGKLEKATSKDFEKTIKMFNQDLVFLQKMAMDPKIDLSKKIPWSSGQTIAREFMVIADHNAYHIGEFAIMRQVMGTWKKGRI